MRTGRSLTVCCSLLPGGDVCLVWGGSPWSQGGFSLPGRGGSAWSGGGCLPGGFSLLGVSAWSGGVLPAGGGLPGLGEGACLPGPRGGSLETPPREQNHRHV